jgi:hypothetical protein
VPLASENELNSLIFQWQQWQHHEDRDAVAHLRPTNSATADPLIAKLNEYKLAVQESRRLRSALVGLLGELYEPQSKIRTCVAEWYKQNGTLLQQAAARAVQRRELKELWRDTQEIMLEADESQLNWCGNQRYSLAVYSLLDLWWGDKGPGENRNQAYVPPMDLTSLGYIVPKDQQYDFSTMKFSREPLLIPVFWPVQVALKLPHPPDVGVILMLPEEFPTLPVLPDETVFTTFPVPDVSFPPQPLITVPATQDLTPALTMLGEFKGIVEKMKVTYERFQPSVMETPDPEQKVGSATGIIHIENDIRERIARLFSRWLPQRKADLAGRAARIKQEFPIKKPACKEDVVCLFLPPEKQTVVSSQWYVPKSADVFTAFAKRVKDSALPATEEANPYDAPTLPVLQRLFPNMKLPVTIRLEKTP